MSSSDIADKWAREWIAAKDGAKTAYAAKASGLANLAIAQKAKMITNWTASINGGRWERRLGAYANNDKMKDAYEASLDGISELTAPQKLKIENSVDLKRYLDGKLGDVLDEFKDQTTSGNTTVPSGISDVGLRQMLMSGLMAFESNLSSSSTTAEIYTAVQSYMNTFYGWPTVA